MHRLKDAGLTGDGFQAMLTELGGEGTQALGQLSDDVLGKLARAGAKPETIERWNTTAEPEPELADDPDDLPAAWAVPA